MIILKKLKSKPIVFFALLLSMSSFSLSRISKASNNILTEDISSSTESSESSSKKIFELLLKDGSFIEVNSNKDNLIINKFDSSSNNILTTEFQNKEGYVVESILPIKEHGFIVISKYNSILVNKGEEDEEQTLVESENLFNILAFDTNGKLINDLLVKDISTKHLFAFALSSFNSLIEDIRVYTKELSDEDIYNLSTHLIDIAQNTLTETDINNAKAIIDTISDEAKRNTLLIRLNAIANESIEEELKNPTLNDDLEANNNILDTLNTSQSYIDLSVDTNNIIFDQLNVSQDTILNKAISLEISSSLPYDVKIYIEGDIASSENNSTLNKSVFSMKESSSNDFITFDDTGVITLLQNQPQGDFISHPIDIRLNTSTNIIKDVYKAVFKIEATTR